MSVRVWGQLYIGDDPPAEDPVMLGSLWVDTANALLKRCSSVDPYTWVTISGGGGEPAPHASTHMHGGTDEVSSAVPGANLIPKADSDGNISLGKVGAVGSLPNVNVGYYSAPTKQQSWIDISLVPTVTFAANNQGWNGLSIQGAATGKSGGSGHISRGLNFWATARAAPGETTEFSSVLGIDVTPNAVATAGSSLTISLMRGLRLPQPMLQSTGGGVIVVTDYRMIDAYNPASAAIKNLYGIKIDDATAAIGGVAPFNRILELGPTPYLRLLGSGSWTPADAETPLYLAFGAVPTLAQVKVYDDGVRKYLVLE